MNEKDQEQERDPRVAGISTVGWVTLSALGICIPLTAILGQYNGIAALALPLAVVAGAGVIAVRIWSSGEKTVNHRENERLAERIAELETRLGNLEMIDSVEAHFAERHRPDPATRPSPATPAMGPPPEQLEA